MAKKLKEVIQLAEEHSLSVTAGAESWMDFLDTSSRLYRYSFEDALLIHAQRPGATACASFDVWNKRMGCYVKRGSEGIALLDGSGRYPKLRYVFDVADVRKTADGHYPVLWQLREDQRDALADYLSDAYDIDRENAEDLQSVLLLVAKSQTDNYAEDTLGDLLLEPESVSLNADTQKTSQEFQYLTCVSICYTLLRRCGLEPLQFLDAEDFASISKYRNGTLLPYLGKTVQQASEPVLKEIGKTVRKMMLDESHDILAGQNRSEYNGSSKTETDNVTETVTETITDAITETAAETVTAKEENGGNHYAGETGLHPEGGLPVSESDDHREYAGGRDREIRDAEEGVSAGESRSQIFEPAADRTTVVISGGRRETVSGQVGSPDAGSGGEISGAGQDGTDGLGETREQSEGDGGRNNLSGIDLHLTDDLQAEPDFDEAEMEMSPDADQRQDAPPISMRFAHGGDVESVSAFNLPEIPSAEEQIRGIEERQAAVYAGVDSVPSEVVDIILRTGSNHDGSVQRLIYNFMSDQTDEEYADFVRTEYDTGGKGFEINDTSYAVWFDQSGMQIARGRSAHDAGPDKLFLSWNDVSYRIRQLLNQGEYAPQVILDSAQENVIKEHAGVLEFFRREMADGVPEQVFKDPELFQGGFQEVEEKLSRMLSNQDELENLVARLDGFASAWKEHPELMRSGYQAYNPEKIYRQFRRLSLKTVPYRARTGFMPETPKAFITQDEVDIFLIGGSFNFGGRLSTYSFFQMHEDGAACADFLKDKYGIGGRSHALSRADDSYADYDSKGIVLTRGNISNPYAKVNLSWKQTARRVAYLIDRGLFLKASDYDHMEDYERERMASRVLEFYGNVPKEIERPFKYNPSLYLPYEDSKEDIIAALQDTDRTNELLAAMDVALIKISADDAGYKEKSDLLAELHGYADGTFTIFPDQNAVIVSEPLEEAHNENNIKNEKNERYQVVEADGWVDTTWTVFDNQTGKEYRDKYDEGNYFGRKEDAEDFCAELNENDRIEQGANLHQMSLFDLINDRPDQQGNSSIGIETEQNNEVVFNDRFHVVEVDWHKPLQTGLKYSIWDGRINNYYEDADGKTVDFDSHREAERYCNDLNENYYTMVQFPPLERAKQLINWYSIDEFGVPADFDDLSKVGIGYTTTEKEELPIEAFVNLTDFRLERYLDEQPIEIREYDSLEDLIAGELGNLDYHELMEVTEEQIAEAVANKSDRIPVASESTKIPAPVDPTNFHITDDDLGVGGQKAKYKDNIAAIRLLKQMESENRLATPEEQELLSRYVGWGGIPHAFDRSMAPWANEYKELQEVLTQEEYREARASTLNAFYTPPVVVRAMYEALGNLGLKSGNVLEPSCGIGNFMGLLPASMDGVKMYGVELDSVSGRIAQQLYQKNMISVQGFETTQYPDNFFDCVVGNVPFGNYKVPDQRYDRYNFMIHDYFIAKSLDLVRPGGVVAVITSSGTMDKADPSVREYIANRAELLGAIRLPENAFTRNAGTETVTDILFLQKRDRAIAERPLWTNVLTTPDGYRINSYFAAHPKMVLGKLTMESNQYGKDVVTVKGIEGAELSDQLHEAISRIKGQITEYELEDDELAEEDTFIPADPSVKNYSYTEVDGEVYYRTNSQMRRMNLSKETKGRTLGLISLRDTVRELIACQTDNGTDKEIEALQERLNSQYDAFTSRYGLINGKINKKAFDADNSYSLLASLEILDEEGQLERKADIFTKRTIRPAEPITTVDTAADALALSIGEKARVDLAYMAELLGTPGDYNKIIKDLKGVIFLAPEEACEDPTAGWHTYDDYLSGNVRKKLETAKQHAQNDERFAVNVEYLEKVQPKDLDASEIDVRLGATWIKVDYIQQFMEELFQMQYYYRNQVRVQYSQVSGEWEISNKTLDRHNVSANTTYGTERASGFRLLEDALNLRDTKIYDTVEDDEGKDRRVLNAKETTLAQQKQEMIKEEFKDWIYRDMTRREDVCRTYNTLFNSIRPREYDGSKIRFVGMNPEIELMEHQKNAVAHILYGKNTLLAHCVGAGKTFEMASAAMESIRLGLARKCLFVVPNHLTQQWGSDFLRLYPAANVLVATKKDFEPSNRRKFCSRIATGQYDAVIIGHSQFERIPLSLERQKMSIQNQIDDITDAIEAEQDKEGTWRSSRRSFTVKQLEKTRRSLETRLARLNDQRRKDDVVTFEQLGVDRLFVDESHYYKNCYVYTKMRNVAGISQTEARKSSDMLMKCQYLDEITGGRGVTFATGTPISNSMTEMYVNMRYLQRDTLVSMNLVSFDAWAATFGETVTAIELAPEGTGYRAKTRFARFYNLPELISVFRECADVQNADMLNLPVPEAEYIDEKLEPSETQKGYVETFGERADAVRNGNIDPKVDNMLKITTDGRKLALDQRLIDDMLPDETVSKVNKCVDNIYGIWKETEEQRSTQLVFSDLSTPKTDGAFNIYDDIRDKLVAKGIPPKEIAYIHTANTEVRKEELFKKVRTGQVRILLGSTSKMGAGTNVQDRLIALHHLDVPWKPSDLEQREGRILRQGNQNKKVKIFRYVTEGTFDAYSWQILENKQKFISQIMTSKSPVRSAEDVDDVALNYAEIKALATANPYIKEKMALDVDVSKLKLLKANYKSNHYQLESDIAKKYPQEIHTFGLLLDDMQKDAEVIEKLPPLDSEHFEMTVSGKVYTEPKEAGEAIVNAAQALLSTHTGEGIVGDYHGFQMESRYDTWSECFVLTLKNNASYSTKLGRDPAGNITRINNVLKSVSIKEIPDMRQKLEHSELQLKNAKEELEKPFAKEDELATKSARLAELNSLLNLDKKDNTDAISIDDSAPAKSVDSAAENRAEDKNNDTRCVEDCIAAPQQRAV